MNEQLLRKLIALPAETEWVEFKAARQQENFEDVGRDGWGPAALWRLCKPEQIDDI